MLNLAHCGLDKTVDIFADDIFKCDCLYKTFELYSKFHWNLSLRAKMTFSHRWFRQWLVAEQETSRCIPIALCSSTIIIMLTLGKKIGCNLICPPLDILRRNGQVRLGWRCWFGWVDGNGGRGSVCVWSIRCASPAHSQQSWISSKV